MAGAFSQHPAWIVLVILPLVFFVVVSLLLGYHKRNQFLWFTSLPITSFVIASYTLEIAGVLYSSIPGVGLTDEAGLLMAMIIFQFVFDGVCTAVIVLKIKTKVLQTVSRPVFTGVLVLALFHPANMSFLALVDTALDFEVLQLVSSFSLTKLVKSLVLITVCAGVLTTGAQGGGNPYILYVIYLLLLVITGFTLTWDVVTESLKWWVARTSPIQQAQAEAPETADTESPSATLSPKSPTAFGERPVVLGEFNDPGSADQISSNKQYREKEDVPSAPKRALAKKESELLHPLLSGEGENSVFDFHSMSNFERLAAYEPYYSKFLGAVLAPLVLWTLILPALLGIGFPLARLCFWRFRLTFGGYTKSIEGRKRVQKFTFAASRGLFLFPVLFFGLLSVYLVFFMLNFGVMVVLTICRLLAHVGLIKMAFVKAQVESHQAARMFVGSCIVWTFVPFLNTLPAMSVSQTLTPDSSGFLILMRLVTFFSVHLIMPLGTVVLAFLFPTFISEPSILPTSYEGAVYFLAILALLQLCAKVLILSFACIHHLRAREKASLSELSLVLQKPFADEYSPLSKKTWTRLEFAASLLDLGYSIVTLVLIGVELYLALLMNEFSSFSVSLCVGFSAFCVSLYWTKMFMSNMSNTPVWIRASFSVFLATTFVAIFANIAVFSSEQPCLGAAPKTAESIKSYQRCNSLSLYADGVNFDSPAPFPLTFALLSSTLGLIFQYNSGVSEFNFPRQTYGLSDLVIVGNSDLHTFSLAIVSFSGLAVFVGNHDLVILDLPNLQAITHGINISSNAALTNLTFPRLATVNWNISISENHGLSNISFPALLEISTASIVSFSSNTLLETLVFSSLWNMQLYSIMVFTDNPQLMTVQLPSMTVGRFLPQFVCSPPVTLVGQDGSFLCSTL